MTNTDKLNYAKSRLALAKMMNDIPEIKKWTEHVEYWISLTNK